MLKFPINQAGQLLSKAALGVQAAHRIHQFMGRERVPDDNKVNIGMRDKLGDTVLQVRNDTFHVGTSETSTQSPDDQVSSSFTLTGINVEVRRGEVLAICGPVASGKSTLIQGLLGDVQCSEDTEISMTEGCTSSYAAQTPFILSATVRENILFGLPLDKDRYEKVLDACCLRPDLLQWPAGGETDNFTLECCK
jgi:ABC-type multidrug transport system fused ATPase/permease subunit